MEKEKINNYVNNKLLYNVVLLWKSLLAAETPNGARIPDRVALDIKSISKNMTRRYNFNGYSQDWKEEMFQDGIEVSIAGIKNYNELKYNNPFGYISMSCYRAFLQRIALEKRETAKKYKYFIENIYDENLPEMTRGVDEDFYQDIADKLADYEKPKQKDLECTPAPPKPLDAFLSK